MQCSRFPIKTRCQRRWTKRLVFSHAAAFLGRIEVSDAAVKDLLSKEVRTTMTLLLFLQCRGYHLAVVAAMTWCTEYHLIVAEVPCILVLESSQLWPGMIDITAKLYCYQRSWAEVAFSNLSSRTVVHTTCNPNRLENDWGRSTGRTALAAKGGASVTLEAYLNSIVNHVFTF